MGTFVEPESAVRSYQRKRPVPFALAVGSCLNRRNERTYLDFSAGVGAHGQGHTIRCSNAACPTTSPRSGHLFPGHVHPGHGPFPGRARRTHPASATVGPPGAVPCPPGGASAIEAAPDPARRVHRPHQGDHLHQLLPRHDGERESAPLRGEALGHRRRWTPTGASLPAAMLRQRLAAEDASARHSRVRSPDNRTGTRPVIH